MRIEDTLDALCTPLFASVTGLTDVSAVVRPAQDPAHGDYQLNGALAAAKRAGKKPREIAEQVASALEEQRAKANTLIPFDGSLFPFEAISVAGPGFINLRLADAWIAAQLDGDRGIEPVAQPQTIVIDFSGPNVAKQMHIGHIRSTILGDVLARLLTATGHKVIKDNHIGDWGTQFGLLIVGLREFGGEQFTAEGDPKVDEPLAALEALYVRASNTAKEDPAFAACAREELAKLQAGDPQNLAIWRKFVEITKASLQHTYDDLGIEFDLWRGESTYNDALPGVAKLLLERGLAREDNGALCIFFGEHAGAPADLKKIKEPMIVRKQDGAFLYSTTDLATAFFREDELGADVALYVVDARQALHFKQIFGLVQMLGRKLASEHISFGSILGADGKPLKTRSGTNVSLRSVLDEAEAHARARIEEEIAAGRLDIDASKLTEVARAVGFGAVKFADLRQNRASDYVFDWDKLIAFKGSAGPTIQYAYARIASIFRKAGVQARTPAPSFATGALQAGLEISTEGSIQLGAPEERALALALLRFGDVVHEAARSRAPNLLCEYLYEVTRLFSSFYEACPILKAEDEVRRARLTLAARTAHVLQQGLGLLGIATVDRM